jgi:CRP/FNR family transcriptional regulator
MATKALANNEHIPVVNAIQGVTSTVARSAARAADAAQFLDISKLAEPCRTCAAWGSCHAIRIMAMAPENISSPRLHSRSLSRGEHVFHEGDEHKAVYLVKTGSVKTCLTNTWGDEQVVSFHFPGDLLSLETLLGMRAHSASAVALEATAICAIPIGYFERFITHSTDGLQWFLGVAGEELVHCQHKLLVLNKMKAETRLSDFLLDLSRRFSRRGYSSREFNLSMSRQDIGNHLGIALETVSRLMTHFQQEGLLEVNQRRRITILDAAGLAVR